MKSKKPKLNAIRHTPYAILAGCLLVFIVGCEGTSRKVPLAEQVRTLREEKKQLTRQFEQSRTEAEQLKKQVQVLSSLPEDKLENLYELQKIKITRYTDFYDKDKDDKKEKLIVYIQPIDEDDDIVKATGAVDVQLWDLDKENGQALLGQWHVKPDELKKLWLVTLITTNYRLTFDVADKIGDAEETLTVRVTFTDYLSGKVFKEQKAIKPR